MKLICILALSLTISSTAPARASSEFVAVEWADSGAANTFAKKCGISLSPQPVSEGAKRKVLRLTPQELDHCEGLTRKLPSTSLFRKSARNLLERLSALESEIPLIHDGSPKFQESVSISQLLKQVDTVQFYEFPWGVLKPDLNRRGFVFLSESRKVIVNSLDPVIEALEKHNATNESVSALLLHEILQAIGGYYDRFYEFSSALWFLSQIGSDRAALQLGQFQIMADAIAKRPPLQLAGGCSLVCGGGDGNEAYFKTLLLNLVLQRKEFKENPKIQNKVIWKIITAEITEILPAECELLQKRGTSRCSIYGESKEKSGHIFFVGDWLESMESVPRMVEAATLIIKDIALAAQLEGTNP